MRTFGLTGGICTGKSTVGHMLATIHGIPIIDADNVARDILYEPEVQQLLVERWGEPILRDNVVDRRWLRARIMSDYEDRVWFDGLMTPRIVERIEAALRVWAARGESVVGVESALLIEKGFASRYDDLVVVTCDPTTQLSRIIERDHVTAGQADLVVRAQLPLAHKESLASVLIRNDGTEAELAEQVGRLGVQLRGFGSGVPA